ncbi:unnamed protein product [Brassica oleracea var. botrytis]|uniref:(rape) hypothetical protein n=1 Tax=Brassica napus TaxID=3708 RepID=A0A816J7Z1_BRANA|nr:unnamed protein product [Brassica napus]
MKRHNFCKKSTNKVLRREKFLDTSISNKLHTILESSKLLLQCNFFLVISEM